MLSRLKSLAADAGVRATAMSRVIALAGAPVTLFLAATRLKPNEQGWYFVAINIVAFAQLVELGLGTIIVQFASHEWPRLKWDPTGAPDGDPSAREAIGTLMASATRVSGFGALALFSVAGIGGVLVFGAPAGESTTNFIVQWCGFVALTAIYLPVIPLICVAEGCGDLIAVQRMRAWQAAAIIVALWTGIVTSGPLAAAWFAAAAQLTVAVIWLFARHRGLMRMARSLPAKKFDDANGLASRYRAEQIRSAQLWIALWATPQLLAPILLRARGGDESGRLGVTLAVATAPLTLAVAWLHGRYPSFGALVAQRQTKAFDELARRATMEAVTVFGSLCIVLTAVVISLPYVLPAFAHRFLPPTSLVALMTGNLGGLLLQAMGGWLRAFRDDGISAPIVTGAACVIIASGMAGSLGGARLMSGVFAATTMLVAVPIAGVHFARVRRERLS